MKKSKMWALCLFLLSILFVFPFCKVFASNRPKVSVVVPVYKVEKWLRQCLDSLVNQTLKEIEIICVDDGSPDNSGAILDEYAENDSRVKVIHQKNAGVQRARNAGLDIATGEYIALVDSDDYVDVHTYETAYNLAKKDDVDILNFKFRRFDDGKDDNESKIDFSDSEVLSKENYIQTNFRANVWDNLFKNDVIQKNKIRFVPGIRPADDTCFTYMALAESERIKSIPAQFYNYRVMPGTLSRMSRNDVFVSSYKMFKHICNSWRSRGCVKNNEHNLLTLIVRWSLHYWNAALKRAGEVLHSFGADIYNEKSVDKCSDEIKAAIKKLEYSAQSNKKPPLKDGIYRIKENKKNSKNFLCTSKIGKKNEYGLEFCRPNKNFSEKFKVKKHDEGYYSVTPIYSKKEVSVKNFSNIKWYLVPCRRGNFRMISEKNLSALGMCKQKKNKLGVKHFEAKNIPEQLFKFEKIG